MIEVLELLLELDNANDEQLDCPFVFASAKVAMARLSADDSFRGYDPLFNTIINYIAGSRRRSGPWYSGTYQYNRL